MLAGYADPTIGRSRNRQGCLPFRSCFHLLQPPPICWCGIQLLLPLNLGGCLCKGRFFLPDSAGCRLHSLHRGESRMPGPHHHLPAFRIQGSCLCARNPGHHPALTEPRRRRRGPLLRGSARHHGHRRSSAGYTGDSSLGIPPGSPPSC